MENPAYEQNWDYTDDIDLKIATRTSKKVKRYLYGIVAGFYSRNTNIFNRNFNLSLLILPIKQLRY